MDPYSVPLELVRLNGREYAIIYAVINGRPVVIDVGIPRRPCTSDLYLVPATPGEVREVIRAWLSRMPGLKDGLRPTQ